MGQPLWAGVDAGKSDHYCVVIDADGQRLLSRRVANDEAALLELISASTALADGGELTWAIDLNAGGAALLIALLIGAEQRLLYIPGRTVHHASGGYRGEGKTDAKDAAIIADQARMRRDLQPLRPGDDIAVELRILTSRRTDLVADRTRAINRLRAQLLEYFPALERAFDYSNSKAALILLTGYQTPDGLRRAGAARLAAWLRKRKARNADAVAAAALEAANAQHTVVPGQQLAATMVARLAEEVMTLDTEIGDTDAMIEERFRRHRHAEIILSMPGFGVILGAEFLAATGGDMALSAPPTASRASLDWPRSPVTPGASAATSNAPAATTDGCCAPATWQLTSPSAPTPPRASTTTANAAEGKRHTQAVLALARRRLNVLWAMLRDHKPYQPTTPNAAAA